MFKRRTTAGDRRPPDHPVLPCPECKFNGEPTNCRIGTKRRKCKTCNRFARNVSRIVTQRMKAEYPDKFWEFYFQAERDLYPQEIQRWAEK